MKDRPNYFLVRNSKRFFPMLLPQRTVLHQFQRRNEIKLKSKVHNGGPPRTVEVSAMVRKPKKSSNGESPYKGTKNLTFNPCLVILALHTQVPGHDLFCERVRCKSAEQKEPNSTRLVFVKKWTMTGSGGIKTTTAIFECPRCKKRKRVFNYGGKK